MADYAFLGKKGTGKSKNVVRLCFMRYLSHGRRVATNLDLFLEPWFGPHSRVTYVRLPDKPTAFDLEAAGHGNPSDRYNEDRAGFMALDEIGTWMNSRSFADKSRAPVLDFLAHARKKGWDCGYIMQDLRQVDAQARESFVEFAVRHVRFDKIRWPFVGGIIKALFGEKWAYMPRFHRFVSRLGTNPQDLVTDSGWFGGGKIEKCYDTLQVFRADYPHGTHSVLSPWHVKGRYMRPERPPFFAALFRALVGKPAPAPAPIRLSVVPLDPDWARMRALCLTLPPDLSLKLMARYARARERAAAGAAGPA